MLTERQLFISLADRLRTPSDEGLVDQLLADDEIKKVLYDCLLSAAGRLYQLEAKEPDKKLNDVLVYIDNNLSEDVSLKLLAGKANLSVYHFSRWFKQHTEKTPLQYVNDRRIELAKKLLFETKKSITCIAFETGHGNSSNFTVSFKRHVGVTPSAYRKSSVR